MDVNELISKLNNLSEEDKELTVMICYRDCDGTKNYRGIHYIENEPITLLHEDKPKETKDFVVLSFDNITKMNNADAIQVLKSKLDGNFDASYEWAETIRLAIKALEKTVKDEEDE